VCDQKGTEAGMGKWLMAKWLMAKWLMAKWLMADG
jgi:hypothetical protein